MQRQRPPLLLAIICAITTCGSIASADLADRVATALRNTKLGSTQIAISVRDIKTGSELIEINDSRPMIPASNMKLFTSGAALDRLGATHALETKLIVQGDTLWFVGAGDPAFGDPEILANTAWTDTNGNARTGMDVDELLDLMARSVAQSGHQHLSELVIDDRVFDRAFAHPEWPQDQYDKRYCAEVAGINLHLNVLSIYVQPASNRRADIVRIEPDLSWLLPRNDAKAPANARVTKLGATRPRDSNDIRVYGSIAAPFTIDITLTDMPSLVGRLFRDRLRANGVSVDSMRLVNSNDAPPPTANATVIPPRIKTFIPTLLERCNTDSQNLYAESLLKLTGRAVEGEPGSWANGTRAVRMVLHSRLGPDHTRNFVQSDGSGLARTNRVAAETVSAWLQSFASDEQLGETFSESLAIVGETGTVTQRMRSLPDNITVRCKTGYIRGVSCLSGIIRSDSDDDGYTFSILCNKIPPSVSVGDVKRLQDQVVTLLANSLN